MFMYEKHGDDEFAQSDKAPEIHIHIAGPATIHFDHGQAAATTPEPSVIVSPHHPNAAKPDDLKMTAMTLIMVLAIVAFFVAVLLS